jgi:hypothetical protein
MSLNDRVRHAISFSAYLQSIFLHPPTIFVILLILGFLLIGQFV